MIDSDSDIDLESMLSPETLAALREHQSKQASNKQSIDKSIENVDENFGLSQFWYTDEYSRTMAEVAIKLATDSMKQSIDQSTEQSNNQTKRFRVAFIACPSIFVAMHKLVTEHLSNPANDQSVYQSIDYYVFEYDRRFDKFGEKFVFYDFNEPYKFEQSHTQSNEQTISQLRQSFDLIYVDPPYINPHCMSEVMKTVRFLSKPNQSNNQSNNQTKVIGNTGAILEDLMSQSFNLRRMRIQPKHSCAIMNPFACYANWDEPMLGGIDTD